MTEISDSGVFMNFKSQISNVESLRVRRDSTFEIRLFPAQQPSRRGLFTNVESRISNVECRAAWPDHVTGGVVRG